MNRTLSAALQSYGTFIAGGGNSGNSTWPKGWLNILVFDKNYNLIDLAYQQLNSTYEQPVGDFVKRPHGLLSRNVTIKEPGYVYIYISNEGSVQQDIYFDDMTITHQKSKVVQVNDYYPFGLTFNSYSRENFVPNQWKFQGQEHIDDLDLRWVQFKWRIHMPDIGRFTTVDPLAAKYVYNSPYAFSENDVVSSIELEGLQKFRITNFSPMQSEKIQEELKNIKRVDNYYYDDRQKIDKSQQEINRIIDYGRKNGFVDPDGKKTDYIIRKLKESNIRLDILIERNLTTVGTELIEEDGDLILEYHGVQYNSNGDLQMNKLGERNYSQEMRDFTIRYFQTLFDFLASPLLPGQLFRFPIILPCDCGIPEFGGTPPMGYSPDPIPRPSPAPAPEPAPEPPMPPDPVVTRRLN